MGTQTIFTELIATEMKRFFFFKNEKYINSGMIFLSYVIVYLSSTVAVKDHWILMRKKITKIIFSFFAQCCCCIKHILYFVYVDGVMVRLNTMWIRNLYMTWTGCWLQFFILNLYKAKWINVANYFALFWWFKTYV